MIAEFKQMRFYAARTFAFLIALFLFSTASFFLVPANIPAEYWVRPMMIEKEEIAAERPSPRILVLGGSGALFNIDAARIEQETGIPTINLGLIGSIRLTRILREADKVARPHDLIIFSLDHRYYSCNTYYIWIPWSLRSALAWDREDFFTQPLSEQLRAIFTGGSGGILFDQWLGLASRAATRSLPANRAEAMESHDMVMARWRSGRERPRNFQFSQFNINANGDIMHTEGSNATITDLNSEYGNEDAGICPATKNELAAFVSAQKQHGVRIVFTHPPFFLLAGQLAPDWREAESKFRADIEQTGAPLIDNRSELLLPPTAFFNASTHLNAKARAVHTDQIVAHLRRLNLIPAKPGDSTLPTGLPAPPRQ